MSPKATECLFSQDVRWLSLLVYIRLCQPSQASWSVLLAEENFSPQVRSLIVIFAVSAIETTISLCNWWKWSRFEGLFCQKGIPVLSDVFGQERGVRILKRVAEGHYTSPLLIVGDDGVGKRFAVQQMLKDTFCTESRSQGCTCYDCMQIDQWTHPDVSSIPDFKEASKDKTEISVGSIRDLMSNISAPSIAPFRLLLVDGADHMNHVAANAILKTLEEPPSYIRFILLAQHLNSVLPTIRSRCGIVPFRPLPESLVLPMISKRQSDPTKALVYTRMGEGSVGRSLAYSNGGKLPHRDKVFSILESGARKDLPSVFSILDTLKAELTFTLMVLEQILHDILLVRSTPQSLIHIDLTERIHTLSAKRGVAVWKKLAEGVHSLRAANTSINLQFHIQSLLATSFHGDPT